MRKSLFLTLVLSLCMADFGAFAATARNARGSGGANTNATQETQSAPVAARAGARQKVVATPKNNTSAAPVSARAGARQKVVSAPVQNTTANTTKTSGNVAARAATKKALAMGTKVATATENTAVDQECQNAYYGCMDAFCMLDNAAGGRCQCSDRVTELDEVLAEIMKIDEQSVRIATEGVETVQMGEFADQINAKAKAIESGIDGSKTTNQKTATTSLSKYTSAGAFSSSVPNLVDLSSLSNSSLFDDGTEDDSDTSVGTISNEAIDDIARRKGDDLQKAAANVCIKQIPAQCKASSALLQMAYVQRVRSDCVGYENALKQQRTESQQKLLTAQKAVRDAVLNEVKEQNKYTTQGECVAEFDKCMQTNGGCGSDYSNCVADDTVLTMNADGTKGKVAKPTSIKTSASQIGVSVNTLAMLTDKAPICEIVLKQCQNVRDGVWEAYLKMIAPTLKSQEVLAEENRRMNCVGNIVDCFSKACAAQWPNQESAEYDMCLANPEIVQNLCQTQITKCSTSGTGDQVMEYVKAKLGAMRVDACTAQVKACLLDEDRCGADYAGCVGLDTETIGDMCPTEKLTACMKKGDSNGKAYDSNTVKAYVAEIAKGLALNIDNKLMTVCQNAAKKAVETVCGSEEDCENISGKTKFIDSELKVQYCTEGTDSSCVNNLAEFTDADVLSGKVVVRVNGKIDISAIDYNENYTEARKTILNVNKNNATKLQAALQNLSVFDLGERDGTKLTVAMGYTAEGDSALTEVGKKLKNAFDLYFAKIENDPTVTYCTTGREVQGFKFDEQNNEQNKTYKLNGKDTTEKAKARFPNLVEDARVLVADQMLIDLSKEYDDKLKAASEKAKEMNDALNNRIVGIKEAQIAQQEAAIDSTNAYACTSSPERNWWPVFKHSKKDTSEAHGEYDSETNICTITRTDYRCDDLRAGGKKCKNWDKRTESVRTIKEQMKKYSELSDSTSNTSNAS